MSVEERVLAGVEHGGLGAVSRQLVKVLDLRECRFQYGVP
jgi:hypothetical protein